MWFAQQIYSKQSRSVCCMRNGGDKDNEPDHQVYNQSKLNFPFSMYYQPFLSQDK